MRDVPVRPVRRTGRKEQCTVGALRAEAGDVDVVTRSPRQKRSEHRHQRRSSTPRRRCCRTTDARSLPRRSRARRIRRSLGLDEPAGTSSGGPRKRSDRRRDDALGAARAARRTYPRRADADRRARPHRDLRRVPGLERAGRRRACSAWASPPTRRWPGSCRPASSPSCCRSRSPGSARRSCRSSRSTGSARSARCWSRAGVRVLRRARHLAQLRLRGDGRRGCRRRPASRSRSSW